MEYEKQLRETNKYSEVDIMEKTEQKNTLDTLKKENIELKKEIEFLNKIFTENYNEAVFNLVRVKKNGEDVWINRIKTTMEELKTCDECSEVNYLISVCNPKPSR